MHAADSPKPNHTEIRPTALPLRNDTMLGVCTGLGEEFGFNPTYLRVAIASLFLVSFKIAIGLYLALGVALLAGKLLFPAKRAASPVAPALQVEANDREPAPESIAA